MQLVKEASAVVLKLPRMVALRAEGRGTGLGRSWLERTGKKVSMDVDGRHVLERWWGGRGWAPNEHAWKGRRTSAHLGAARQGHTDARKG